MRCEFAGGQESQPWDWKSSRIVTGVFVVMDVVGGGGEMRFVGFVELFVLKGLPELLDLKGFPGDGLRRWRMVSIVVPLLVRR